MSETLGGLGNRLVAVLADLLRQVPELEAAAVVSVDGLPMACALPPALDEDQVAAMSAALLSLGERAAAGLGRGALSQVYIEGEQGTVFLLSAQDEAVLVGVAGRAAKAGLMLYELRRAALAVARVLGEEPPAFPPAPSYPVPAAAAPAPVAVAEPSLPPAAVPAQNPPEFAPAPGQDSLTAWTSYAAGPLSP
jgi:predicted regulator of Ras-like GTPase activity (Roadblock/LC7/MglB family)